MTAPSPRRVLIVDDEPANIHLLAAALRDGYELSFATTAMRALELAAGAALDLILLDVVMPGMDGFEILRRLKADPTTRGVPVIFVTSLGEVAEEEHGFALGAVDYITKPASPPIVRARVQTHIELKRQRDLLEQRAAIDGLTGIANRRRFDEVLQARWQRALRTDTPLGLMLLDVDHFKQFNDAYGHVSGDDCLRRVALALASEFSREGELAARFGGEEFAVLLAHDDVEAAARRALDCVRALRIAHAHSGAGAWVSVSGGALAMHATGATSAHALIEAADGLLYAAKGAGRDRVVIETWTGGAQKEIFSSLPRGS
jgi:diguanylate cyclase (GGDEF)-like protein